MCSSLPRPTIVLPFVKGKAVLPADRHSDSVSATAFEASGKSSTALDFLIHKIGEYFFHRVLWISDTTGNTSRVNRPPAAGPNQLTWSSGSLGENVWVTAMYLFFAKYLRYFAGETKTGERHVGTPHMSSPTSSLPASIRCGFNQ